MELNSMKLHSNKKWIYKTFTVTCEKSKTVSFACSITKNIVAPSSVFKFAVKLIY